MVKITPGVYSILTLWLFGEGRDSAAGVLLVTDNLKLEEKREMQKVVGIRRKLFNRRFKAWKWPDPPSGKAGLLFARFL